MKILIFTLLLTLQLFPVSVSAKNVETPNPRIEEYFEKLSHDDVDFEPSGMVCERVAMREVETMYPTVNFDIVNSISYTEHKTTIGELDIVVFDKSTNQVEAVAEVKCWTSFSGGLRKAKDQRVRFLTHLNNNIILIGKNGKTYSKKQFSNIQKYFTISQAGGVNQGFDFELSLTYKELMGLRGRLLDCKSQGRCPIR